MQKVRTAFMIVAINCAIANPGLGAPPVLQAKISVPGTEGFGCSLAASGDTVIVGTFSGQAYVIQRDGDSSWTGPTRLTPLDDVSNRFGRVVDIYGDTAIVGSQWDFTDLSHSNGGAHIFKRGADSSWEQQTKLRASDFPQTERFGFAVGICNDTVFVSGDGATYLFQQHGTDWVEQANFTTSHGGGYFIEDVSSSGDTALIDSWDHSSSTYSADVYKRDPDSSWTKQTTLPVPGPTSNKLSAFAISGDTIIGGEQLDSEAAHAAGAAHVFVEEEDGSWAYQAKLMPSDAYEYQYFGRKGVDISGSIAVIGGYPVAGYGYVYMFQRDMDLQWTEQLKLVPADTGSYDYFGRSVAILGDTWIIGASADDDQGDKAGAVYIYVVPTFTSNASDTWDTTDNTWDQGAEIPATYNTVIVNGHTVTVDADGGVGKSLQITGNGTVLVNGALAISEDITVDAGSTLTVDGSLGADGLLSVAGTLSGTGLIDADIELSGMLAPGDSPGTLTILGGLALSADSTYEWEVGDLADVDALSLESGWGLNVHSDGLVITGNSEDKLALFTYGTLVGDPTTVEWIGLGPGDGLGIVNVPGGSGAIYLTGVIPEPSTLVLLATGLLTVLLYAWRKRK